ncbi:hypothetical protein [Candidatus Berkiella aquae]|uniref:Uncharacterized protein n=1 Tax=Candidatus Berkiella aquae TaxID=295108 RepID=A0A0Q9YQE7_9GAMM|nr:hypothetical protein [Candidatus Berkiella aquae]MCS5712660.1 hypothetical protein [Candidatus Berkiella aquae]
MSSLILHPTTIAQWYALVNEAEHACAISLSEDLESYLVFLLQRFTGQPEIASSVLGLDFLKSYQQVSSSHLHLKDVGDKCLLLAGLFPGRAVKRRVKLSYFVKLGQTAYSTLSSYVVHQEELFNQLCYEFPKLLDVLLTMRTTSETIDLFQSLELWHETGSQVAWKRLRQVTASLPITDTNKKLIN